MSIARQLGLPVDDRARGATIYGIGRNDVTPYGMTDRGQHHRARGRRARPHRRSRRLARATSTPSIATSPVVKKGLATMPVKFGISFNRPALNQAGALVHVYTDGSVVLNHGGTEMGQGLFVKVAQVVAEAFSIDLDHIRVSATSTGKVPNTSPTAASSGSDLNGMAALNAAEQIKARMTEVAAEHFGVPTAEILFSANRIYAGNRSMSFAELAALSWEKRVSLSATGYYRTPKIHWDFATNTGRPFYYFAYGAAAAEVAIDTLTGETRVLRAELLQDCGALAQSGDRSRPDRGRVRAGHGLAHQRGTVVGRARAGCARTGLRPTRSPAAATCRRCSTRASSPTRRIREETMFRSKAVGEPPLMLAISVWLAIRDAIASLAGHRVAPQLDAPATPERVLAAIDDLRDRA